MEPKKINSDDLKKILKLMESSPDDAAGAYLYKGYKIQISKFGESGSERYLRLYWKRKEKGLCIRCGKKVTRKNPATGDLYRLCEFHRETMDQK